MRSLWQGARGGVNVFLKKNERFFDLPWWVFPYQSSLGSIGFDWPSEVVLKPLSCQGPRLALALKKGPFTAENSEHWWSSRAEQGMEAVLTQPSEAQMETEAIPTSLPGAGVQEQ